MWRLVRQWSFLLFYCLLTVFDDWYTLGRPVTIGTVMVKNSQETVKTAKMTIGVPIVTSLSRLYQPCTNSVPIVKTVKNSKKTVKTAKMTIDVPIVTYQQCTNGQKSQNTVNTAKMTLVYQSSHVYQDCTNRVPTVYQKQSKDSQNSKNHRCCTNRHISTQCPPNTQNPQAVRGRNTSSCHAML